MKKHFYYHIQLFLVIAISCLISISCQSSLPDKISSNLECRLINHELGETCVPLNPQRIIVTDQVALEDVIALGLKPMGAPDTTYVASKSSFLKSKMSGINYIGKEDQFNLEKILNLHPDLIISLYGINSANYQLFSKIAPTVQFKYVHAKWQTSFRQIGEVLGKAEQAENLLTEYKQRLTKLRTVLNNQTNQLKVSGYNCPNFVLNFHFLAVFCKKSVFLCQMLNVS